MYVGDWNVTIIPNLDNINYLTVCNEGARRVVKNRIEIDGLVDVWRRDNPLEKVFT